MSNNDGGKPNAAASQHIQNMQSAGSGLTRYRSAPSSYFTTLLNSTPGGDGGFGADDFAELFNPRASSPETQQIFSQFMNSSPVETVPENNALLPNTTAATASQFLPPPKHEPDHGAPPPLQRQRSNDYSSPAMYQANHSPDNLQNKGWGSFASGSRVAQIKMEGGGGAASSGLIRQSSSPAGLFANINIESEFGGMRGTGIRNYGGGNNANAEASFSSASRLNSSSQLDFSSKTTTMGDNIIPPDDDDDPHGGGGTTNNNDQDSFISDYINSWDDDSSLLSDSFLDGLTDHKSSTEEGGSSRSSSRSRPATTMLSHHLSLPKSVSAELSMEKMLQDSVPCKIRAKRGCATHPRSIAERVRRTKISERIRKLQELVPNMEKQTSTSDMLDLAVDYIKELQKQVKTLSDSKDQCTCGAKHR